MNRHMSRVLSTHAPSATILIRIMVGAVFVSEGSRSSFTPTRSAPVGSRRSGFPRPR